MEMSVDDLLSLIFFIFLCVNAVGIIIGIIRYKNNCPKCNRRLSIYKISSPFGINVTKKFIITPFRSAHLDTIYKCSTCNLKYVDKEGYDEPQVYHGPE